MLSILYAKFKTWGFKHNIKQNKKKTEIKQKEIYGDFWTFNINDSLTFK